jgi:hypothetical protein
MAKCTSLLACCHVGRGRLALAHPLYDHFIDPLQSRMFRLGGGGRGLGLVLAWGVTGFGGVFFDMPEHYHVWEHPQEVGCGGAEPAVPPIKGGEGRRLTYQTTSV